jgi:hypothetical protein
LPTSNRNFAPNTAQKCQESALFCTAENHNRPVINHFRTLALKRPGGPLAGHCHWPNHLLAQPFVTGLATGFATGCRVRRPVFPPSKTHRTRMAQLTAVTSAAYGHPCNPFVHSTIRKHGGEGPLPGSIHSTRLGRKQEGHARACPHIDSVFKRSRVAMRLAQASRSRRLTLRRPWRNSPPPPLPCRTPRTPSAAW